MTALAAHDTLLPRAPGGNGAGAALAVAVHVGLVVALTVSVDWRSQPPDVVSAELWAAVPQIAAPKPQEVAPTPTPPPAPAPAPAPPPPAPAPPPQVKPAEPDIALEREQRRRRLDDDKKRAAEEADADKKRAEADNKKKREQDAREAKAEEQRLAEQREANLRRMMGQASDAGPRSTGTASQDAAPSASYAGKVRALIRNASVFTGSVPGNPAAEVEVTSAASGTIISRRLVKSSGFKAWDDAVLQAIDKVGALPRDTDGRVPSKVIISFQPNER